MPQFARTVRFAIVMSVIAAIIGYGIIKSWNLIEGPSINIWAPGNGATVYKPLVNIEGEAHNISFLSLNGRQIFVNEEGYIKEQLLLPPGYSILTFEAKDRFGREITNTLQLVYKPR